MYIMGMEKVMGRSYAEWKKSEKNHKHDDHNNHRGPRRGLPVGLCLNACPA